MSQDFVLVTGLFSSDYEVGSFTSFFQHLFYSTTSFHSVVCVSQFY